MTESDLSRLRARVERAQAQLRAVPATGPGVYGSPDPETGERWNAGNVLGHLAEMIPFWTAQARSVMEGAGEVGRGTAGYESRRGGIDSGQTLTEPDLRARIDSGLEALLALIDGLQPSDLQRQIVHRSKAAERSLTLRELIDELLVGHLEAHAKQLAELIR